MTRLMTAAQVAETFGLPNPRTLRTMRSQGLKYVPLGKAILYDEQDVAAFIESKKVQICQDQTPAPGSSGSKSASPITSSGTSSAVKGSRRRAQETSERLKKLLKTSSGPVEPQPGLPGHLIPWPFPLLTPSTSTGESTPPKKQTP